MYHSLFNDSTTDCIIYPDASFEYNDKVGISVISLSSIGFFANAFLILSYSLNLFYRQKSKTSSLDKLFLLLSIVESLISIYWLSNALLFFYDNKGPVFPEVKCQKCKNLALLGIFLYCLDWTLLTATIYQFKQIISNPIVAILKPDKQIRIYFILCVFASLLAVLFAFLGKYYGINPMFTCFVSTKQIINSSGGLTIQIISIILFSSLMFIPTANFFYGLYQSIIMLKNIISQNDIETKNLFKKYISYFFIYIASTFCLFILHICDILIDDDKKDNIFLSFAYGTGLLNCSSPLIVALFRLLQKHNRHITKCCHKTTKVFLPYVDIVDEESKNLERGLTEFENESIKRMMRDIYISICYLASQSRKKSSPLFPIKQNYYKETSNYQISFETLMTINEQAIKDDPIIKEAKSVDINIFEFAPRIFAALRRNDELTQDQIIESFLPNSNKQGIQESQGRSGNFFINTDDKKFILKTINYEELELIRGMLLEKMTNHFNSNSSSIISRIYGIYKIIMPTGFFKQEEIILILMKNVCDIFGDQILSKYDIKGSKFDRSVTITNMNFSTKVMKDNNFEQLEGVFFLNEENSKRLLDTIKSDANFFRNLGVMDYSLLVVKIKINEDEMKYLFGMRHRETTEKEYIELFKETVPVRKQSIEEVKEMEEIYNRQINKSNIRFDRKEIISLKKYMYPSLNPDTMYIFSIIDFFQLYDIKKNLETQMKRLLAKKENISSVPPEDYARRFINNIEQKTNCKQFFDKNINKDAFPILEETI